MRKNNVDISKVKVTLGVQRSKMAINDLVLAITMSFIVRFLNNNMYSIHLFTIIGRCVMRKNYVDISKVKVTLKVQRSKMAINDLVLAITMSLIVRFKNDSVH